MMIRKITPGNYRIQLHGEFVTFHEVFQKRACSGIIEDTKLSKALKTNRVDPIAFNMEGHSSSAQAAIFSRE